MIVCANFTSEENPPEAERPGYVGKLPQNLNAGVVELEYTWDLSPHAERIEGSRPSARTINNIFNIERIISM